MAAVKLRDSTLILAIDERHRCELFAKMSCKSTVYYTVVYFHYRESNCKTMVRYFGTYY